jgi:hypothetical protein
VTHYVDAHLADMALKGEHEAVRQVAGIAADLVRTHPDKGWINEYLAAVLSAIADGQSPNDAFLWKKQKPLAHDVLLKWSMARHVEDLIAEHIPPEDALDIVGRAASCGGEKAGTVYKAWKRYAAIDLPLEVFPIPPDMLTRIETMDRRVERQKLEYTRRNAKR